MQKTFTLISIVVLFLLLGTIGSIEKEILTLSTGVTFIVIEFTCFAIFTKLSLCWRGKR